MRENNFGQILATAMLRTISSLLGGLSFATLLNRLDALSVEKDRDGTDPFDTSHSQGQAKSYLNCTIAPYVNHCIEPFFKSRQGLD